jgi:hypothetical protein
MLVGSKSSKTHTKNVLVLNISMEVTQAQKDVLLNTNRTADHLFRWVYDVLHSGNISLKQYRVLIKIHDMLPTEQLGYIIHQDTLWPVPTKVRKYQKYSTGWKERKIFRPVSNRPKKYKKDK